MEVTLPNRTFISLETYNLLNHKTETIIYDIKAEKQKEAEAETEEEKEKKTGIIDETMLVRLDTLNRMHRPIHHHHCRSDY